MDITILTTGGTIAKTYDECLGSMCNYLPVVEAIVSGLRTPHAISYQHILCKDSLDLTDRDRSLILSSVEKADAFSDAVIVIHGTDTLPITGEMLHKSGVGNGLPVILTGAMRPYEFRDSDAAQNVTEAILACQLVRRGVWVTMHSSVLRFPGVVKDCGTFRRR